jgi:branched-chain amino acid transport system ATP-binding protein
MSAAAIIEAKGLHTYYSSSHILHGIDFTVRPGETVSLLGRNGMGKTTTLRSILGLTRPKRGEVRINGRDMTGAEPYRIAREGIAFVPEGRGIFHNLTVREHLQMAAAPGPDGRAEWTFERIMTLFPRLAERLDNHGNRLSGGEQQMLTIGRALMTNPRLLILDEATEGLAPLIRAEIYRSIEQLKSEGLSILVIDKDVKALTRVADRHYVLEKGRVVWSGTSAELAADTNVQHRYLGV